MQVVCNIIKTPTLYKEGESPFVAYEIEVNVMDGPNVVHQTKVLRRYSDFRKLAKSLKKGGMPVMDIPGKLLFNTASAIEARKVALQESLNEYCAKIIAKDNRIDRPLSTFLGLQDHFRLSSSQNMSMSSSKDIILNPDTSFDTINANHQRNGGNDQSSNTNPQSNENDDNVAMAVPVTSSSSSSSNGIHGDKKRESNDQGPKKKNSSNNDNKQGEKEATSGGDEPSKGNKILDEFVVDAGKLKELVKGIHLNGQEQTFKMKRTGIALMIAGIIAIKVSSAKGSNSRLAASWFCLGAGLVSFFVPLYMESTGIIPPSHVPKDQ